MDERLDEIKHNWNETDWGIRKDDIDWLIHQAELRQEQVNKNLQALENIDVIQRSYDELKEENQRYKDALEKITKENSLYFMDKIARQALKGDKQ